MIRDHATETIERLSREHPAWECWHVSVLYGPDTWSARRRADGDVTAAFIVNSAEELDMLLRAADGQ